MNEPDCPARGPSTWLLSPNDDPARLGRAHLYAWQELGSEQRQECLPVVAGSEPRGCLDGVAGRRGNHRGYAVENGRIDPDAARVATIGLGHRVPVLDRTPRVPSLKRHREEGRAQRGSESDANYNSCGGLIHPRI